MIDMTPENQMLLAQFLEDLDEHQQEIAPAMFTMIAEKTDDMNAAISALEDGLNKADKIESGTMQESDLREAITLPALSMDEIGTLLTFYKLIS